MPLHRLIQAYSLSSIVRILHSFLFGFLDLRPPHFVTSSFLVLGGRFVIVAFGLVVASLAGVRSVLAAAVGPAVRGRSGAALGGGCFRRYDGGGIVGGGALESGACRGDGAYHKSHRNEVSC